MKKLLCMLSLVLVFGTAYSQSPLAGGKAQLNAGVGLTGWGVPFYLGLDFGVHRDISLGVEASFRSYNEKWNSDRYRHSILGFSGNANYHFNTLFDMSQKYDFYAGGNLGFYVWNSPDGYPGSRSSGLGFGGQVGGRIYFTPKVGLNVELGGGNAFSGGKVGVSIIL